MNKIFDIDAKEFGDLIISDVTDVSLMALKIITGARYSLTITDYTI